MQRQGAREHTHSTVSQYTRGSMSCMSGYGTVRGKGKRHPTVATFILERPKGSSKTTYHIYEYHTEVDCYIISILQRKPAGIARTRPSVGLTADGPTTALFAADNWVLPNIAATVCIKQTRSGRSYCLIASTNECVP